MRKMSEGPCLALFLFLFIDPINLREIGGNLRGFFNLKQSQSLELECSAWVGLNQGQECPCSVTVLRSCGKG